MPAWNPAMPWPSATPGGAWSPHWGGYVKLWARAAIAAGRTWHLGPHDDDRLDAGNVLGGAPPALVRGGTALEALEGGLEPLATEPARLWIDLSCDVRNLEVTGGASSAQGILSKPDAAVCTLELSDPTGKYDPLSPSSPFTFQGRSRLLPGVPIEVFAEVVNAETGAVTTHPLFTGAVESWGEDWTPSPRQRVALVRAVDETARWVKYDRPEAPAVGAGDTTAQRVQRLVTYYGWLGTLEPAASSTVTLQATTLAATGWELLNRTLDDELGYVYFTPAGNLRWLNRAAWLELGEPVLSLGCDYLEGVAEDADDLRDVLVDASPSAVDYEIRNAVYAARTGGTQQTALSASSVARFGRYDYSRTDLGLQTDAQAAEWASAVLQTDAYPRVALDDLTMRPALDPRSWELFDAALGLGYVSDLVRVAWAPPDRPTELIDGLVRVVGHTHTISRRVWETRYVTSAATSLVGGFVFTLGPHAQDRLDAGFVLG